MWGPNPIDHTNPNISPLLPTGYDWVDCYIRRVLATLPFPYRLEEVITGKVSDQSILKFLEDVLDDKEASSWDNCL